MSTLITVDPGLDYVVACVWDTTDWHGSFFSEECARRFRRLHELHTKPKHALEARLRQIAEWMGSVVQEHAHASPVHVEIERPAKGGASYRRNLATQITKTDPAAEQRALLYTSIGALVAAVPPGVAVELSPAHTTPKLRRRALVDAVLPKLRGRNADVHDAAYMGLVTLSSWRSATPALTPR